MALASCLVLEHQLTLIVLALVVCASGVFVTVSLFARSRRFDGLARIGWLFLASICAGSTTWTTHFVAMLGYRPNLPAVFDPFATSLSIIVAILGAGLGFGLAAGAGSAPGRAAGLRNALGGAMVGLSIAGMHYIGMFGYRVDGIVRWNGPVVALSVLLSAALAAAALVSLGTASLRARSVATLLLILAVLALHFTGMQALSVTPLAGTLGQSVGSSQAMAVAVAVVAMLVIGGGLSACIIDMDARIRSDRWLMDMAYRDPLTGLQNRRALQAKMDAAFAEQRWFKLLMVDLDHFKSVNDTFGHAVGDKLLCAAAERFREVIGPDACAYRIGGDELAAMIFKDRETAMQVAGELVVAMREPIDVEGHRLVTGCSVGICAFEHADDGDTLMRRADSALYEAKRRGRGQVFRYTPGMLEAAVLRTRLEADLQKAAGEGQLHLLFQPIVDVATGRLLGREALLRWTHPDLGNVPPGEFIPIAEAGGSIVGIGQWVLEEACRAAAAWPKDVHLAVNVSAVQLRSLRFPALVARVLADTGLSPHRLTIELTETAIVSDDEEVARRLDAVRILGVKVAMDDFGTGYSSLSHLRRLPVDVIKIDRSFVASAETDRNSMAVLRAIVAMGHDMQISTVGEGVETPAQAGILSAIGCDAAQGYLFGRPEALPAIEIEARALRA